jgi:hypothetical protein
MEEKAMTLEYVNSFLISRKCATVTPPSSLGVDDEEDVDTDNDGAVVACRYDRR